MPKTLEEQRAYDRQRQKLWHLKSPEKRRAIIARFDERHPGIHAEYTRRYREKHPDRVAQYISTHKAHKRQYDKQYNALNRERLLQQSRVRYLKQRTRKLHLGKLWRKNNPDKSKACWIRSAKTRYALKRTSTFNLKSINEYVRRVKSKRRVKCYYCENPTSTANIHFDHIAPLSKRGPHSIENLCVACRSCNSKKHDKPIRQWIKSGQQIFDL